VIRVLKRSNPIALICLIEPLLVKAYEKIKGISCLDSSPGKLEYGTIPSCVVKTEKRFTVVLTPGKDLLVLVHRFRSLPWREACHL
jgi:hypothetical protein